MSGRKCIRCYFSGERAATDTIKIGYGSATYELDLCSKHAQECDDVMWGWLRAARETPSTTGFNESPGLSEVSKLAPAVIPRMPERLKPKPEPVYVPVAKTEMDILRLRWTITKHAWQRLEERGQIAGYEFTLEDVLMAAEHPERTFAERSGNNGRWVHLRGPVKVVVNREDHVIFTCSSSVGERHRVTA